MDDGISTSIPIVGGFPLGTSRQTSVYVSSCLQDYDVAYCDDLFS